MCFLTVTALTLCVDIFTVGRQFPNSVSPKPAMTVQVTALCTMQDLTACGSFISWMMSVADDC